MTDLDREYNKAYVEVLEILKHIPVEILKLIPKDQIDMFKEYRDRTYNFSYNLELNLKDQNISETAKAVLAYLYEDYIKDKI